MIKNIKSSEIKKFIENNPKTVLLDVRTEDEWNTIGKPDTKDLGIEHPDDIVADIKQALAA